MIFRNKLFALAMAALLFLMWGCSTPRDSKHKTWFDLVEISDNVMRAKETAGPDSQTPDNQSQLEDRDEGPRIKDLSMQEDSGNQYLEKIKKQRTYNAGEAIDGEGVILNFDNADIYEVIQVIAETLDLSYIIDPQVKGVVNIRSGNRIPKDQLFVIFKKLLNINGLDIRSEGDHDYIFVASKPSSLAIYDRNQVGKLEDSSRMITQIVPVMHIASAEALKLIEPYLSEHSVIYNLADQNLLIVSDFEGQVVDALMILAQLDVSSMSSLVVRMVRVENAPLYDLQDELKEVLSALKINKKDHEGVQVLPLERVNSLLLIGYNQSLISATVKWIEELDRAPTEGRDSIYIYNVRNSLASELTELVSSLIEEKDSKKKSTTSKLKSNKGVSVRPPGSVASKKTSTSSIRSSVKSNATGMSSMQFAGEPVLISDDARNIVLIRALFADYKRLVKLLERLDNLPMQVLIEVLVAEVSLTDELKYGVQWALKNNKTNIFDGGITFNPLDSDGASTSNTTFNLAFDADTDVFKLLDFLATNNDFTILSSPQVLVLNNETATVNVGEQVPIVTSETSDTTSSTTSNRTVQYKDTGVILNVTPRINYDGIILVEIEQQVSSVKSLTTGGLDSPTISTKKVKTKLAVKDGQSILMGGLIAKNETDTENGLPLLKDIPYLGYLFKTKTTTMTKTELLIMVTPYVIESEDVLDQYIKNFKGKMLDLRKELDSS